MNGEENKYADREDYVTSILAEIVKERKVLLYSGSSIMESCNVLLSHIARLFAVIKYRIRNGDDTIKKEYEDARAAFRNLRIREIHSDCSVFGKDDRDHTLVISDRKTIYGEHYDRAMLSQENENYAAYKSELVNILIDIDSLFYEAFEIDIMSEIHYTEDKKSRAKRDEELYRGESCGTNR